MRKCILMKRLIVIFVFIHLSSHFFSQTPKDNVLGHYVGLERVTNGIGPGAPYTDCPNTIINIKPDNVNYPRVMIEDTSCAHPDLVLSDYEVFDDSTVQKYWELGTIYGTLFPNDSLYFYRWDDFGAGIKTEFFGFKQYNFAAPIGIKEAGNFSDNLILSLNPANELLLIQNNRALFSVDLEFQLFNLNGKIIGVPYQFISAGKIEVDVSNLNSGMYFLVIETTVGMVKKKLVVQH